MRGITPELLVQIEAECISRAAEVAKIWRDGLSHKDWFFDGSPIRGNVMLAKFDNLDWANAWIDLGPSIAGNLGPYWHVPLKKTIVDGETYAEGDTVHRLYPKVLQSKWALLILHACNEMGRKSSAPVESGWRTMDSAPKDGTTYVDLWVQNRRGDCHRVPYCHWGKNTWDNKKEDWCGPFLLSEGPHVATHWMPLPAPPSSPGGTRTGK